MIRRPPRSTPLSLHDALPICLRGAVKIFKLLLRERERAQAAADEDPGLVNVILPNGARYYVDHAHPEYSSPETSKDRKSTRLNSSHANISYAVFCLKKKHQLC